MKDESHLRPEQKFERKDFDLSLRRINWAMEINFPTGTLRVPDSKVDYNDWWGERMCIKDDDGELIVIMTLESLMQTLPK